MTEGHHFKINGIKNKNEVEAFNLEEQLYVPRKRRRRILVSSSDDDFVEQDLNHFDFISPWNKCQSLSSISRPLKTAIEILAVAPQTERQLQQQNNGSFNKEASKTNNNHHNKSAVPHKLPPILERYLKEKCISIKNQEDNEHSEKTENSSLVNTKQDPLTDSRNSTLSEAQHSRYLHLLNEFRKNNNKVTSKRFRKEFQALTSLVQEERQSYIQALRNFQFQNKERFLIGFKVPCVASEHTATNSKLIKEYHNCWLRSSIPTKFGKCYQEISVKSSLVSTDTRMFENAYMASVVTKAEQSKRYNIDLNGPERISMHMFSPRLVEKDSIIDLPSIKNNLEEFKGIQLTVPLEVSKHTCLVEDEIVKKLAIKHNAEVVITAEAMEALLQRPEGDHTNWKMPTYSELVTNHTSGFVERTSHSTNQERRITFIDDPIPSQSTAREWLTKGIQEALHQFIVSKLSLSDKIHFQNVYTLLIIPSNASLAQKPTTVIVRSRNFLAEEKQSEVPVQLFTQLQYFPERGLEELSSHEKSIILLKKMLQPSCKIYAAQINPKSVTILDFQELYTELFLGVGNTLDVNVLLNGKIGDIYKNFHTMMNAISGAQMTRIGWNILSLPGVNVISSALTTISVHPSTQDNCDDETIDIDKEFANAESVLLSPEVLIKCFKMWTWNSPRSIFTYPSQLALQK